MNIPRYFLIFALATLASGCTTRSISNSDYDAGRGSYYGQAVPTELSEFDVLGIDRDAKPTDEEIATQLSKARSIVVRRDSKILLIQSGAMFPDEPMVRSMSKRFSIGQFSGQQYSSQINAKQPTSAANYSRSLRLAAAQGGHDKILAYWGVLESARENLATSAVSWVPVVGWILPDERQRMRIRLKLVLIDVATGQWEMFTPDPIDDRSLSTVLSRRDTDHSLVASLKERAYQSAADDLSKRFER